MKRQWVVATMVLVTLLLLAGVLRPERSALAQSGDGYTLTWYTIDGGGGTLSQPPYTLSGTIGQPDAGVLANGSYTLAGGFWALDAGVSNLLRLFLPLIRKQ